MNVRVAGTGMGFTEGPVFKSDDSIVVTSIDRGHLYEIGENGVRLLAVTGGGPNGATEGSNGSIYVCQNGGRGPGWRRPAMTGGIQEVRKDGAVEWITTDPISPNDLCFGPDGYLYVTDPTRGPAQDDGRLWRVDLKSKEAQLLASVHWYPNGIGFGREDDFVYVAATREGRIIRYALGGSGLGKPEVAIQMDHGRPDGFAFDSEGNIIIAAIGDDHRPGDIQTWSLDGKLLDVFEPGDHRFYTNVALGVDRKLVITDSDGGAALIVDNWPQSGLSLHPFRHGQ